VKASRSPFWLCAYLALFVAVAIGSVLPTTRPATTAQAQSDYALALELFLVADGVYLSWQGQPAAPDGYRIERRIDATVEEVATLGAGESFGEYTDSAVNCDTRYVYRVIALFSASPEPQRPSSDYAITTPPCDAQGETPPPADPTDLVATATSETTINLSWADTSDNEEGFALERSPNGTSGWEEATYTEADATSADDGGLACNTTYFYRIASYSGDFLSGYSAIASATTLPCPLAGDLTIEVVQVLGQQFDLFVAGKDAAVLVNLPSASAVDPAQQQVVIKRDGATIATLQPQPSATPTTTLIFQCASRQACDYWRAGIYSFEATINGATVSKTNVKFQARRALRVLAVPVTASFGGEIKRVSVDSWKTAGTFMRDVYPVAPDTYEWKIGPELDVSDADVLNWPGRKKVWDALKNLQPKECRDLASRGPNCFDKIIGFLAERPSGLNGYTYGDPANIVAIQPSMIRTIAHEVGHNFDLGDEYNMSSGLYNCEVNPPPPSFVGTDRKRQVVGPYSCTDESVQPWTTNGSASRIIATTMRPFEVGGRGLLPDKGNFMGNLNDPSQAWVSPNAWRQIFTRLAPPAGPAQAAAVERVVLASGAIGADGSIVLDPWYTYESDTRPQSIVSPYQIQAIDTNGGVLARRRFELEFEPPDQLAPLDAAPFNVEVPFPVGTVAYRILNGTTELVTVPVSGNAPSVQITAPTASQDVSGVYTIRWTSGDGDGGQLFYDVEYSPSGNDEDWLVLASGLTANEWTEDFSALPGSPQARIRVTVTDGVQSSAATSAVFSVPPLAPEAYIYEPLDGETYSQDDIIVLDGDGYDYQDSWLFADESLAWSSDKDGELGNGPLLFVEGLSVGEHTITLRATNSLGVSTTAQARITITPASAGETIYLPVVRN
jgi:hypothetical protein